MLQAGSHRVPKLKELYTTPIAEPGSLERAVEIAAEAHAGQKLPSGEPYILHPLRMLTKLASEEEQIVAVLHDVVEKNGAWSFERLRREGFSSKIVDAVEALTKHEGEGFMHAIERVGQNALGRTVKRADITDHLKYYPTETLNSEYADALLRLLASKSNRSGEIGIIN